jgi:hypothetical protein
MRTLARQSSIIEAILMHNLRWLRKLASRCKSIGKVYSQSVNETTNCKLARSVYYVRAFLTVSVLQFPVVLLIRLPA